MEHGLYDPKDVVGSQSNQVSYVIFCNLSIFTLID